MLDLLNWVRCFWLALFHIDCAEKTKYDDFIVCQNIVIIHCPRVIFFRHVSWHETVYTSCILLLNIAFACLVSRSFQIELSGQIIKSYRFLNSELLKKYFLAIWGAVILFWYVW